MYNQKPIKKLFILKIASFVSDLTEHALYVAVKDRRVRPPLSKLSQMYPHQLLVLIMDMWEGEPQAVRGFPFSLCFFNSSIFYSHFCDRGPRWIGLWMYCQHISFDNRIRTVYSNWVYLIIQIIIMKADEFIRYTSTFFQSNLWICFIKKLVFGTYMYWVTRAWDCVYCVWRCTIKEYTIVSG